MTYIGDLLFSAQFVRLTDKYDEAIAYMAKTYPNLDKEKIVKSLIVLGEAFRKE